MSKTMRAPPSCGAVQIMHADLQETIRVSEFRDVCLNLLRCNDQQLVATGGTMGNAVDDPGTIPLPNVSRRP